MDGNSVDPPQAEPTLLEYARYHGIAVDHLAIDPLDSISSFPRPSSPQVVRDLATDPPGAPRLEDLVELTRLRREAATYGQRPQIDEATAKFIFSVIQSPLNQQIGPHLPPLSSVDQVLQAQNHARKAKKDLYVEPPLLKTDHECDFQSFMSMAEKGRQPNLKNEFFPSEDVDTEADEGLEWPSWYAELPGKVWKGVESEKLKVGSDVMQFLQQVFRSDDGALEECWQSEMDRILMEVREKRAISKEKSSPLLMPMSSGVFSKVLKSEMDETAHSADHGHTIMESKNSQGNILRSEGFTLDKQDPELSHQELKAASVKSSHPEVSSSPLKPSKELPGVLPKTAGALEDALPHSQLTSPTHEVSSRQQRKGEIFKEQLTASVLHVSGSSPISNSVDRDHSGLACEYITKSVAVGADPNTEQRRSNKAKDIARTPVPAMDFSVCVPPWAKENGSVDEKREHETTKILKDIGGESVGLYKPPLSDDIDLNLRWNPFPGMSGEFELKETIEDDGSALDFIRQPDGIDVESLLWKSDGLRLFDDLDEPEDELERGYFPVTNAIQSLVMKRRLEFREGQNDLNRDKRPRLGDDTSLPRQPDSSSKTIAYSQNSPFAGLTSLKSFIDLRRGRLTSKHKEILSNEQPKKKSGENLESRTQEPILIADKENTFTPAQTQVSQSFPVFKGRRYLVISSTFLQDRHLSRQVLRHWPNAEIIERDVSQSPSPPRSHRPQPNAQNMRTAAHDQMDEADITLSPSTGLIWTNLQHILQRPLPGQFSHETIRDRIRIVSKKYERLFIAVSQDQTSPAPNTKSDRSNDSVPQLGEHDAKALSDFAAFCRNTLKDNEINVTFLSGGKSELADWIVKMMATQDNRTANLEDNTVLRSEESPGETFLRNEGANAYAAQVILLELECLREGAGGREARNVMTDDSAKFEYSSVQLFMRMPIEERIQRFEHILGGRKLLERIRVA